MIYLKNNTEIQAIYIPRQTVLGSGYIATTEKYEEGYNDGFEDGKKQQKEKLSNLCVTENGQYEREDGWNVVTVDVPDLNGSYDEGYEQGHTEGYAEGERIGYDQGQADVAANARVLNVTENGTYVSKFSDPIPPTLVTGIYADGTDFYNYAELNGKVFNTKIAGSVDSRLEFWYKGDNAVKLNGYDIIIGAGDKNNRTNCFQIRYYAGENSILWVEIETSNIKVNNWDDTVWHHLIVSRAEGILIDGEKKGDFSTTTNAINGEFYINGAGYDKYGNRNANGCFGMIKIDDVVFIPTADGFQNVNTGELLEVVIDGTYTFTENLPIYGEGELYKTINVNVPDLNGSYDEGYREGEQAGYNSGYDQGQADVAANARVLNVTENGTYVSKFSDPIPPTLVTGIYADGTDFYNYAELNGKVFNTKIAGSVDSRLEFWYKGDNQKSGDAWNVIIGSGDIDNSDCFQVRYYIIYNDILRIEVGNSIITVFNWDDTVWHHLIISKAEGLWIDGEKKGDFSPSNTINGEFFINGIGYVNNGIGDGLRDANGTFGMIKIDDVVIIPTADGFLNTNTGELLEVVKDGTYAFTENLPIYGEGELYKTINVNVPDLNGSYDEGKIDGINEQKSKLETINITVNGTYNRADGYNKIIVKVPDLNGSYDEGYEQGQADIATNAIVLNVTENGVYKTKFSDPIMPTTVTGVYADGTDFYNYAYLNNIQYNTNIYPMSNTKIEIWWKYDGSKEENEGCIIGCQKWGQINSIFKIGWNYGDNRLLASINDKYIFIPFIEGWNHIVMSYADGLWLNGVKIGTFPSNITDDMDNKEPICINGYYGNSRMNSDYFGMVKINDVVFIPTENGFLNTSTNELLPIRREGDYTFTKNLPTYGEGEIYKTINVNVPISQEQSFNYDITAFTYKVYDWTSVNINRDNITNDCGHRPLDCLLFRNRSGECTVMTKLDNCSGVVRLENGWNSNNVILSLKSNTITKFSSNSINSNQLTSIDTGFARLEGNAIMNCNALTDIKVTVLNDNLSTQFATNCFNGLPAEGTITIGKNVDVTITNDEIISFFRTIVGEGWTITIK